MSEPAVKHPIVDLDEFERRLRRAASPQAQDDPLAELARLVGGHEDPFKAVFDNDQPVQPTDADPALPNQHAVASDSFAAEERLHGTLHPDTYAAAPDALAGHRLDQPPAVSYAPAPSYAQAPQVAYEEDEPWLNVEPPVPPSNVPTPDVPRSRRPLYIMAGIVALGVAGIGASYAYKSSKSGSHQITTILAQSGPTKVQPDQPGGTDVPNQDASILDKSSQPIPAATVSHQEQPVDLAQQPIVAKAPLAADPTASGAASVPVPPPPGGQRTASSPGEPGWQSYGMDALIEPNKVKTVSVRSDGTLLPNDKPPQLPSSVPAGAPAPQRGSTQSSETTPKPPATKATTRVIPMVKPTATPPQSIEQLAGNDTPAAAEPAAPKPKPVKLKPAVPERGAAEKVATAETGDTAAAATTPASHPGFAVQFAAPASEQEAHELTAKLMQKFGDQLSGHRLTYHRAKSGDKSFYRVRSSGLSKEEANSICQKVQSSGGSCFVAKD
jgi:hypothetical protein